MRWLFVVSLALSLWAGALQESVERLIGPEAYAQNRLILKTVFSHKDRFYKNGRLNFVKITYVLKRLGLIPEKFETKRLQRVAFETFESSPLFMKLMMKAMEEAEVFGYVIDEVERDEEGMRIVFSFESIQAFDAPLVASFLEKSGVKVLGMEQREGVWRLFCDARDGRLGTVAIEDRTIFVREPLWIGVAGKERVWIESHPKNHWFAQIVIYDQELHPLQLIEKSQKTDSLEIALPKGSYYIKISDRFTTKNIKYGLRIRVF